MKTKLKCASFFAGVGGIDLGFTTDRQTDRQTDSKLSMQMSLIRIQ